MLIKTWRSSNAKKAWAQIQEKDIPSNWGVFKKSMSNNELTVGTTLIYSPPLEPSGVFSASLYGPSKCWLKTNRLPDISPAKKMGVFRISKKISFGGLQLWSESVLVAQSCPTLWDPHRQQPTRLLCPWKSPGKKTGVGCHFLLQGILPTQRSNLCFLLGSRILYHWATWETLVFCHLNINDWSCISIH